MQIKVYYLNIRELSAGYSLDRLNQQLPLELSTYFDAYTHWRNEYASKVAVLMLMELLTAFGLERSLVKHLKKDTYGKPYIPGLAFSFSIAHSRDYVVCAATEGAAIGVDIEYIRPVETTEYRDCFTPEEWGRLQASSAPLHTFFELWTKKESLIKADGRGMSIPLQQVMITEQDALILHNNSKWYHYPILVNVAYKAFICTPAGCSNIVLTPFTEESFPGFRS